MQLTHRHIEVFRAVMHCGQVTRAAEWLHTSQPTLSRELARLEQVLGYALFDRIRGRMHPTARALALMEEVQASYVGLQRVAERARALARDPHGRLQLACLPALAQSLVPSAVAALVAADAEASVTLEAVDSPALETALTEQRFDLGLGEIHAGKGCATEVLLTVNEVCVLPPDHRLAQQPSLQLSDFEGERFISLAPGDPYRLRMDPLFEQAGVQRQLQLECSSAASICALVAAGAGVALVNPLSALSWHPRTAHGGVQGAVVLRPLAVDIPFQVVLSWPLGRPPHPQRDPLIAHLRQAAQGMVSELKALLALSD